VRASTSTRPTVGRSHGIHAEPTTFGLKLAQAYAEFARAKGRLTQARTEVATCAISGAIGTFANVDPRVEAYVADKMGLKPEPISTQVIPRDRHAMYFATLAVIASSLERLAIEVRHLQRTEVLEAEDTSPRAEGLLLHAAQAQSRGSENITGLARWCAAIACRHGERGALARARHLPLLRRAHDRARRHSDARFHPGAMTG
jgi:adenylosuccinate lyase